MRERSLFFIDAAKSLQNRDPSETTREYLLQLSSNLLNYTAEIQWKIADILEASPMMVIVVTHHSTNTQPIPKETIDNIPEWLEKPPCDADFFEKHE